MTDSEKFRMIARLLRELNETPDYGGDLHVAFNHAENEHTSEVSSVIEDMEGYASYWETHTPNIGVE